MRHLTSTRLGLRRSGLQQLRHIGNAAPRCIGAPERESQPALLGGTLERTGARWRDDWRRGSQLTKDPAQFGGRIPDATGRPLFLDESPRPPMLLNLRNDPLESIDLADQQPDRVGRMLRELENWWEDVERDRRSDP